MNELEKIIYEFLNRFFDIKYTKGGRMYLEFKEGEDDENHNIEDEITYCAHKMKNKIMDFLWIGDGEIPDLPKGVKSQNAYKLSVNDRIKQINSLLK